MRVGSMFSGTVEEIAGQNVQTKFFILGLPIVPMESYYVLSENMDGIQGFEIDLHPKSVLLGFVRMWMLAPIIYFFVMWMVDDMGPLWLGLSVVLWVILTFVVGGPSAASRRKRTVLGLQTGIFADPTWLRPTTADGILDTLKEKWIKLCVLTGKDDWREMVADPDIGADVLPLVFALSEYSRAAGSGEWIADGVAAWEALEKSEPL